MSQPFFISLGSIGGVGLKNSFKFLGIRLIKLSVPSGSTEPEEELEATLCAIPMGKSAKAKGAGPSKEFGPVSNRGFSGSKGYSRPTWYSFGEFSLIVVEPSSTKGVSTF